MIVLKKIISILLALVIVVSMGTWASAEETADEKSLTDFVDLEKMDMDAIDTLVHKIMKKSKVPGMSMVIVNRSQNRYLNYGYADKDSKKKATSDFIMNWDP